MNKIQINYLYFLCCFLFLITLTCSHFLHLNVPFSSVHFFFIIYAFGQALLEVLCFMILGYFLYRKAPAWIFSLFTGFSFILLLAHFANFTLVRLMDVSLSYFFIFFLGCGLDHIRIVFQAMNLNASMIAIIIGSILLVPAVGIGFYWATRKISLKKPLALSQKQLLLSALCLASLLFLLNIAYKPYLPLDLYSKYRKTLPLGSMFLAPTPQRLPLASTLEGARAEPCLQQLLLNHPLSLTCRPNIYLFIIETLRSDFLTEETAPHLHAFSNLHPTPQCSYSNANSTHLSWFAIFHSCYPYHWTSVRDHWEGGSFPLQLLKQLGYRIRAYSSAELSYFSMDQVMFGKERRLLDSLQDFSQQRLIEPCERDRLALKAMASDVEQEQEGTIFIVFLDSTHSEYSSPKDHQPFQPAAESIDYLAISQSTSDLELVKNRYRNAIHWIDHLIGSFFQRLQNLNLYTEAIVMLTGDHGEEFFEEGALFHGTHLNDWQTRVPILCKFPGHIPSTSVRLSCHMDLFPSLLHTLFNAPVWEELFDGRSLFVKNRPPYILTMQHNGPDVPYEFSLSDGASRLIGRFVNPPIITSVPSIELVSWKPSSSTTDKPETYLSDAIAPLLHRAP